MSTGLITVPRGLSTGPETPESNFQKLQVQDFVIGVASGEITVYSGQALVTSQLSHSPGRISITETSLTKLIDAAGMRRKGVELQLVVNLPKTIGERRVLFSGEAADAFLKQVVVETKGFEPSAEYLETMKAISDDFLGKILDALVQLKG
jgi:hypothetical protein